MPPAQLRDVFLASAKGRVLDRLRRAPQTVEELAASLRVTDNAVRSQLAALEREGLVQRGAIRPGVRRPSHTYRLVPGMEGLFCEAYGPFLNHLLDLMSARTAAREMDDLARRVGRRLAAAPASGALRTRVKVTAAHLDRLGAVTEVEAADGAFAIHGRVCPLDAVVRTHAVACAAVESLVEQMTGAHARQRCHRAGDQPHCLVEVRGNGR